MKKYSFVKTITARKVTLAPGFRFVKGTDGGYTVRNKQVAVAGVSCRCKDIGLGRCSFGLDSSGYGSCKASALCKKGCSIIIEEY